MKNKLETVVLAGRSWDTPFWDIKPFVSESGIPIKSFFTEQELLAALCSNELEPMVIFLSVTCATDMSIVRTIRRVRNVVGNLPLVVAVQENTPELEDETRRAGVFYYMILPPVHDEIVQVVRYAVQAGRQLDRLRVEPVLDSRRGH